MKQTITITLIAGAALGLGACAAGRGPGGEIIVGLDVATLPESATEFGMSAAKFLPSPWGDLLAAGIGGTGLLVGAHYRAKKKGEDAGWTDAVGTPPQAPVYAGASGVAAGPVPAVPNVSAGAGAGAQAAASPVVGPSGVAGGDWPASASLPVAQG